MWHQKCSPLFIFFSFLKFCIVEPTIPKKCFLFFRFWHFWWENDVTKFPPNFALSIIGYLMTVSERTHCKDVKRGKIFETCLSTQEIYHFEIWTFLVTKWRKSQLSKRYIFWVDRHVSKKFSLLTSLWSLLSETIIRCPIILKTKFGRQAFLMSHMPTVFS